MTMVFMLRGFMVVQHDTNYTVYYGKSIIGRFNKYEDVESGINWLLGSRE